MTPEEHLAAAEQLVDEASDMDVSAELSVHVTLAQLHIQLAQVAAQLGIAGDVHRWADMAEEERAAARRAVAALADAGTDRLINR